jgi:DNA-binding LytR/AlgR family response regulator
MNAKPESMKAIIIEDENLVAQKLVVKIKAVADDIDVVEILPSLKTARKWFMQNAEPDLIFMDVQLSDGVSFELFEIYKLSCPVIFTTAYDEYAVRAFKVNGIDYLLKPIDDNELKNAIEKCRKLVNAPGKTLVNIQQLMSAFQNPQNGSIYKEKFVVNFRNSWMPIKTSDIAFFMRENLNYLFTFSGEKYILDYDSLEEIEELLDPKTFWRANRRYIINVDSIQSVKPQENQKLTVLLKQPLKVEVDVSREKAPAFKKWIDR